MGKFHCGFEEDTICMFIQDKTEEFDWTRHSAATRDTKYTPNTGPSSDRTGSKQGFYMYIETSRPRLEGDKARLLTPSFNVAPKNPYGNVATNPTYCFSFYYHMYGKHIVELDMQLHFWGSDDLHSPSDKLVTAIFCFTKLCAFRIESVGLIPTHQGVLFLAFDTWSHRASGVKNPCAQQDLLSGCTAKNRENMLEFQSSSTCTTDSGTLNVYLRQKSQTGQDTSVWTLSGNQGDRWRQARVNINPTSSFQMVLEGIRGSGIEGDIAIDDVTIEEGECRDPPPSSSEYKIPGFSRRSAYMAALSHFTFGLGRPPKVTSSRGGGTQLWHS
ncbi:hypothetical protein H4Q32_011118 [Labeo rohita]|uniref:MAM domain-containing protein n=1 Tax=Labeo rohita TaxID=84645 RepID=A0ABQ8LUT8_LABRO|nr:hypothetical protein H4Q32_011118 [Labeo rohita]